MYIALLGSEAIPYNTLIWKLKLPLKIKVFLWYLYKGVTLTKDNLARRQWQGDTKCCFCSSEECHFAKFVWRTIHVSFNLTPPTSVHHMFTDWLDGFNRKLKSKILVGASAICWVIWLTQNDIVFDKVPAPSYLQVIFRGRTGPGSDHYYRRRRMAKWWRWVVGRLRQPWWRCLQETFGDSVIELRFRCCFGKL